MLTLLSLEVNHNIAEFNLILTLQRLQSLLRDVGNNAIRTTSHGGRFRVKSDQRYPLQFDLYLTRSRVTTKG